MFSGKGADMPPSNVMPKKTSDLMGSGSERGSFFLSLFFLGGGGEGEGSYRLFVFFSVCGEIGYPDWRFEKD